MVAPAESRRPQRARPENKSKMDARYRIHSAVVLTALLAVLWIALSGHYTPLLLALGAASVALCVWLALRMGVTDEEMHPGQFHLLPCLLYVGWLAREVVLSAVDVSRRILDPALPIDPTVVRLPVAQSTDAGRTIYANSITLTPGTVSIDLSEDTVEVHALTTAGAEALAGGEMNRRVAALERDR